MYLFISATFFFVFVGISLAASPTSVFSSQPAQEFHFASGSTNSLHPPPRMGVRPPQIRGMDVAHPTINEGVVLTGMKENYTKCSIFVWLSFYKIANEYRFHLDELLFFFLLIFYQNQILVFKIIFIFFSIFCLAR